MMDANNVPGQNAILTSRRARHLPRDTRCFARTRPALTPALPKKWICFSAYDRRLNWPRVVGGLLIREFGRGRRETAERNQRQFSNSAQRPRFSARQVAVLAFSQSRVGPER